MTLQVSLEVDPGVFSEDELTQAGATLSRRYHKGWMSVSAPAERLSDLRGLPGVFVVEPVLACDEAVSTLDPAPEWARLGGDQCAVLTAELEAGRQDGHVVLLRQRLECTAKCFIRSHRTSAQDIVVSRDGADGKREVVCRYTDGVRDQSHSGMHDWKPGETHTSAMWVGHLPPGAYHVRAGLDGWVRIGARLQPFAYSAEVQLG